MSVKTLKLDRLKELFYVSDGLLYWKNPPAKKSQLRNTPITCKSRMGYIVVSIERSQYFVHRIIYQMMNDLEILDATQLIDHVDGNRSNNNIDNLRIATASQNMHNRKKHINNKSGHKFISKTTVISGGVPYSYWLLSISRKDMTVAKRFKYTEDGLQEAIIRRDTLLKELHGEFANKG